MYPISTPEEIENVRNNEHPVSRNPPTPPQSPDVTIQLARPPNVGQSEASAVLASPAMQFSALTLADARQLQIGPPMINGRPVMVHRSASSFGSASLPETTSTPSSTAPLISPPVSFASLTTGPMSDDSVTPTLRIAPTVQHTNSGLSNMSAHSQSSAVISSADDPLRILVVDDDGMTRSLMSRMLTKLGCLVETANDGEQCLTVLLGKDGSQARRFDLVSLDNQMPVSRNEYNHLNIC